MKLLKSFGKLKKPNLLVVRQVAGDSMLPALRPGRIVLGLRRYDRLAINDIVIFRHDGLEKIKRITKMKDNKVFLAGDNQHQSTDSRTFGWLDSSVVVAKVMWPRRR